MTRIRFAVAVGLLVGSLVPVADASAAAETHLRGRITVQHRGRADDVGRDFEFQGVDQFFTVLVAEHTSAPWS